MPRPPLTLRPAVDDDAQAINDIYNHYVLHSTTTYQEIPSTLDERRAWIGQRETLYPAIVAVDEANAVVGWSSLSKFRERSAYRTTCENSVYVRHELRGRGIGSTLLADQIERARVAGFHSIMAVIDAAQESSIAIHRKFGFDHVGTLREIGRKFDRWVDVVLMQKLLG